MESLTPPAFVPVSLPRPCGDDLQGLGISAVTGHRICAHRTCPTKLSRYNPGAMCSIHEHMEALPTEPPRAPTVEGIPRGPIGEFLRDLLEQAWSVKGLAAASGLHVRTIRSLRDAPEGCRRPVAYRTLRRLYDAAGVCAVAGPCAA